MIAFNIAVAQEINARVTGENMVSAIENYNQEDITIKSGVIDINSPEKDTVRIRIGRKRIVVIEKDGHTVYEFFNLNDKEYEKWTGKKPKFQGNWSFFEMGVNTFSNVDYSGYDTENWMDLNHNRSYEVNINLIKYSIGLQKQRNTIGLVTGLGMNFNDYRFSHNNTIVNEEGITEPDFLEGLENISKSKLSTFYLHTPLILEFQIPVNNSHKRIYLSGGAIGGIKLRSHTKVKHSGIKDKNFNDFNIKPFRYGLTARLGYRGINIFSTYYLSEFFEDGRGPVTHPYTIGIGIINL